MGEQGLGGAPPQAEDARVFAGFIRRAATRDWEDSDAALDIAGAIVALCDVVDGLSARLDEIERAS